MLRQGWHIRDVFLFLPSLLLKNKISAQTISNSSCGLILITSAASTRSYQNSMFSVSDHSTKPVLGSLQFICYSLMAWPWSMPKAKWFSLWQVIFLSENLLLLHPGLFKTYFPWFLFLPIIFLCNKISMYDPLLVDKFMFSTTLCWKGCIT